MEFICWTFSQKFKQFDNSSNRLTQLIRDAYCENVQQINSKIYIYRCQLPLLPYLRHTTFKAHFWQKSPPKKFRYKAHFFEVKIYLLKNEVILGWFKVTLLNFVNFCSTIFQKWRDCTSYWQIFGNFWRILAKMTEFALVLQAWSTNLCFFC